MSCPMCDNNCTKCAPVLTEKEKSSGIRIALAGNPNCGKTSAFNAITGSRQHVGNYPGITVEKKEGWTSVGEKKIILVDLPGTYSLTAYSIEEKVTREVLAPENAAERPRAVIDVVDSGTLNRSLLLALQIRELGHPVVLACNMMDEARKAGVVINLDKLSERFGVKAVPTVARTGEGLLKVLNLAVEAASQEEVPLEISYGSDLDNALLDMARILKAKAIFANRYPARWTALKFLEGDTIIQEQVAEVDKDAYKQLSDIYEKLADHLAKTLQTSPEAMITDYRYGYINSLLKDGIVTKDNTKDRLALTDTLDSILTNVILGPAIMIAVMYFMFWATFTIGAYPQGWVEDAFAWLAGICAEILPEGDLRSLLCDGIISGVGGVLTFVPLIMIMFVFISYLEDSGYTARMAYMLDKVMRIFGLHGSSVMPFIIAGGIAGGCAIPGVMATRTMRSEKERMATLMTVPLMNCGAKVPVFLMLTAAFFAENQASIMLAVTLCGWLIALFVSRFLRSTVFTGASTPFVMELPPYRFPTVRSVILHTWERSWMYMKKAGTVILAISVILWAALHYPALDKNIASPYEEKIASYEEQLVPLKTQALPIIEQIKALNTQIGGTSSSENLKNQLAELEGKPEYVAYAEVADKKAALENELAGLTLKQTYGGRLGVLIEPFFSPLGFDWRTDVALISGIAAKEAILSTMGTAYTIGAIDSDDSEPLAALLQKEKGWTKTVALALMIFTLIYSPCFVTLVVIKNETGKWKWVFFSMVFNTGVAYVAAYAATLLGRALWG